MKTGLFGQQHTLMEELKAATFLTHARLQTAPFFEALAACQLPLESYVGQLRALAVIHGVLEHALESCSEERVATVWQNDMRKLPLLLQDLKYFEPRAVADLKESTEAALKTAEHLRLRSVEDPLALLGFQYVLEGSMLGAVVLYPLYARAFLLSGGEGLSYLHTMAPAVHQRWSKYQERMNALPLEVEERERIAQAADGMFVWMETVFLALYPFKPESKTFLVTSINPEAGRHPVPADPREIDASLRAADLCWRRFPYYENRYGERGLRFARSDAAWLATLCAYDLPQINQQVRWLGRVLAGRGMPSCLLQVQLEVLAEELTAVVPDKQSGYAKLTQAAADLCLSRRKYLDDTKFNALSEGFDHAVGKEWSEKFPHMGGILVCAVTDELEGSGLAVESLLSWMTDPARFPEGWITAVEETLVMTRKEARA